MALGESLELQTVAEVIETVDQLNLLAEMGCRLGQGYLLSRPMSPDDLARLVIPAAELPRWALEARSPAA